MVAGHDPERGFSREATGEGRDGPWGDERPTFQTLHASIDGPVMEACPASARETVNPCGCRGMAGNVMEWCLDPFDETDQVHVRKGGACVDGP